MDVERIEAGLALRGELDMATAGQLDPVIQEVVVVTEGDLLLDLTEVSFMDSSGVNALLRAQSLLGREERRMAIVCPQGPVGRVLEQVGIADLFIRFDTRADAEQALAR